MDWPNFSASDSFLVLLAFLQYTMALDLTFGGLRLRFITLLQVDRHKLRCEFPQCDSTEVPVVLSLSRSLFPTYCTIFLLLRI